MKCNCGVYEHDICFDGVITYFSQDCLCCRNTSEGQEAVVEDRHGNAKENAEFIVKAVNNHDALVAAIEKLYSYIDYGKFANERTDDADFIDAVLKQVK